MHGEVISPRDGDPDATVPGLMALGEAACVSVHGANRLGSNSLIDLVVFGRAAALRAAEVVDPDAKHKALSVTADDMALERFDKLRHAKGGTPTAAIRDRMQRTMQTNCSVFRTGEVLEEGVKLIGQVAEGMSDIGVTDRALIWNTDLLETLELDNLIGQAVVSMSAAANRTESRGAHAGEDFADRDDVNWMTHPLVRLEGRTKVSIDYRPVHSYTLTDEVQVFPPKPRVY
jgi:succinate dehydrogenase / fumarate reductase flavoprotein subunit